MKVIKVIGMTVLIIICGFILVLGINLLFIGIEKVFGKTVAAIFELLIFVLLSAFLAYGFVKDTK